ncbi:MAG: aspartate 1-decarboxylase [Armatimonadota bacterium]
MQLFNICKSKIHRATVTEANVDYVGSVTIDVDLMERAGIKHGELVHIWNVNNGNRWETYAIPGQKRSGVICVNGAAAHLCKTGDKVIIVSFVLTDEEITPKMILVDEENKFLRSLQTI